MAATASSLTAQHFGRRYSVSTLAAFLGLVAVALPLGVLALIQPLPLVLAVAIPSLLVLPILWQAPVRSVYLLFIAALLVEVYPLNFADSLTDRLPLFGNLNNSANLNGIPVTPAELLMLAALVIWAATSLSAGRFRLPTGRLVAPYLAFAAVLALGEVHGLMSGGDANVSLWELRPQIYGFVMFLLTASLVTERRQLQRLTVLFIGAVAFKAMLGAYRFFVTLHGSLVGHDSIFAHEESYFLALLLVAILTAWIWMPQRRGLLPLLALAPLVMLVLLENQRRVGVLALGVAVAVVVMLAIRGEPALRRRLVVFSIIGVLGTGALVAAYWNHDGGLAGQLVRPIRSQFQPDQRDYLSDIYRVAENANLTLSFRSSPVIGMGFGRPFLVVYPQADISQFYPFWNYIPHNTILWLGIRMGTLGYLAFFGLIGLALLEAMRHAGRSSDRLVRGIAVFAVAAIVAELIVAYGDLQLENYRNLIFLGAILGVVNRLPELDRG